MSTSRKTSVTNKVAMLIKIAREIQKINSKF